MKGLIIEAITASSLFIKSSAYPIKEMSAIEQLLNHSPTPVIFFDEKRLSIRNGMFNVFWYPTGPL